MLSCGASYRVTADISAAPWAAFGRTVVSSVKGVLAILCEIFPFPPGRERCRRWVQPVFICLAMGHSAAQLVQRAGWHIWNAPTCRNTSAFKEAKCALINACLCTSLFMFAAKLTGWLESQRPNAISTFRSMLIARLGNWTTVLVCNEAKREICFSTKVYVTLLW